MPRIAFPEAGLGQHADWMLARPEIAVAMGGLSQAVYNRSELGTREREAARYTIALFNDCKVCRATRAKEGAAASIDDDFYGQVASWRMSTGLSSRERLGAEFAERFAIDHLAMDDAFWARMHTEFADEEIADLTMCCGAWLGMGRALAVIGVEAPEQPLLV